MSLEQSSDVLVIGAGYAGAVSARVLAEHGKQVKILERRKHIGGNAYDGPNEAGILVHHYGPHIFHTNDEEVFTFLSRFTSWREYAHRVVASLPQEGGGRLRYPVPFNLTSLQAAFGPEEGTRRQNKLLSAFEGREKVTILELKAHPDPELSQLADYIYEHIFVHYTQKQWGKKPEEIDPNTTARVPILLSWDDRYFQDTFQGMPERGYTKLFESMLDHPNITWEVNRDGREELDVTGAVLTVGGQPFQGQVIYTGPVDELFGFQFGALPYRTLDFVFETLPQEDYQGYGTVNYTMDQDYTRITEFKHLTGQKHPHTTIVKEYPRAYTGEPGEIPYYPIINEANQSLYAQYQREASRFPNFHLLGRLAEYQYYNMDGIVARALALAHTMIQQGIT